MLAWVRGCMGGVPWKGNWVVLIPKEKIQVYPNPGKFKGLRKAPGHGQNPVSQSNHIITFILIPLLFPTFHQQILTLVVAGLLVMWGK